MVLDGDIDNSEAGDRYIAEGKLNLTRLFSGEPRPVMR